MRQIAVLGFALAIIACSQAFDHRRLSALNVHEPGVIIIHEPAVLILEDENPSVSVGTEEPIRSEQKISALDTETVDDDEVRSKRSPRDPPTGKIVVTGGARRGSSTGGKTEGNIHVGGEIRFRRSAEELRQDGDSQGESNLNMDDGDLPLGQFEEKHASLESMEDRKVTELREKLTEVGMRENSDDYDKNLTGTRAKRSPEPKRRHRTNVDINFGRTFTDKKGNTFSINGGASKRPGERWDPQVGVSGSFRF